MKDSTGIYKKINKILASWNPIGVPKHIAFDEYKQYIPLIATSLFNKEVLKSCLEKILSNNLKLGYDPNNEAHSGDIDKICERLMKLNDN